ncbi:hypothetical protein TNCV_4521971 [Trichonephila clavipes]|nr:hypothetical protein TNCV_4521971 [Trichonephila clavipes]
MRARNYYDHPSISDHWALVHEQMSRLGGLSEERPPVFKTPSKLGTHLSTHCSGDERQSRPCGQGIGSWQACLEFETITPKDLPFRAAMHVKSVKTSNVLSMVWCGSHERGERAQASSSSFDHGSKFRGQSPKALV